MPTLARPNYSSIDIETAIERIRQLESSAGLSFEAHPRYGFTGAQTALLGMLIENHGVTTREHAFTLFYGMAEDGGPDQKIFDVFISQIRRKLRPYSINIGTVWGRGWYMEPADRARARLLSVDVEAGPALGASEATACA